MKILRLVIVYLTCLVISTVSSANDSMQVEPYSIPQEQIKKGITNLISSVNELKEQIQALKDKDNELVNSIQNLGEEIKKQVAEIEKEMNSIVQANQNVDSEVAQLQSIQENLVSRINSLEKFATGDIVEKRIFLGENGSALVFKVNELEELKDQLPSEDKCSEFGSVLENFPARSLNAFFVMSDNGTLALCKLEYGMSDWSIVAASIADRGHVIAKE